MKGVAIGVAVIIATAGAVVLWRKALERIKKLKAENERIATEREEKRKKLFTFFSEKLSLIRLANADFAILMDFSSGYFSNFQLKTWQTGYNVLFKEIESKTFQNIGLKLEDESEISHFISSYTNCVNLRIAFNSDFVPAELKSYETFFNNIEGRSLDSQQRTSIVTDDDNSLVIAGAGSGKTTTIIGKVNYLIDRYGVSPQDILLISFTNKSAATLAERINIKGIEALTFHKFGKDVIVDIEQQQPPPSD
jgi:DNA helicase-4